MTKHEENPILYAPKEGVDYVTCRTCNKCIEYEAECTCPHCQGIIQGEIGICLECGDQIDLDEPRTGADAECWLPL